MPAHTRHESNELRTEGFRSVVPPGSPNRPVRVHLPTDYQPKYAYPLVVLFHAEGECEDRATRLVPLLSRRNYVTVCLRGKVALGRRADGRSAFGWSAGTDRGPRAALAHVRGQFSVNPPAVSPSSRRARFPGSSLSTAFSHPPGSPPTACAYSLATPPRTQPSRDRKPAARQPASPPPAQTSSSDATPLLKPSTSRCFAMRIAGSWTRSPR